MSFIEKIKTLTSAIANKDPNATLILKQFYASLSQQDRLDFAPYKKNLMHFAAKNARLDTIVCLVNELQFEVPKYILAWAMIYSDEEVLRYFLRENKYKPLSGRHPLDSHAICGITQICAKNSRIFFDFSHTNAIQSPYVQPMTDLVHDQESELFYSAEQSTMKSFLAKACDEPHLFANFMGNFFYNNAGTRSHTSKMNLILSLDALQYSKVIDFELLFDASCNLITLYLLEKNPNKVQTVIDDFFSHYTSATNEVCVELWRAMQNKHNVLNPLPDYIYDYYPRIDEDYLNSLLAHTETIPHYHAYRVVAKTLTSRNINTLKNKITYTTNKDKFGNTPLYYAALQGSEGIISYYENVPEYQKKDHVTSIEKGYIFALWANGLEAFKNRDLDTAIGDFNVVCLFADRLEAKNKADHYFYLTARLYLAKLHDQKGSRKTVDRHLIKFMQHYLAIDKLNLQSILDPDKVLLNSAIRLHEMGKVRPTIRQSTVSLQAPVQMTNEYTSIEVGQAQTCGFNTSSATPQSSSFFPHTRRQDRAHQRRTSVQPIVQNPVAPIPAQIQVRQAEPIDGPTLAHSYGFDWIDVPSDGACFFHAVHQQLQTYQDQFFDLRKQYIENSKTLRTAALVHICKYCDYYGHYLVPMSVSEYLKIAAQPTYAADEHLIAALSRILNITIVTLTTEQPVPHIIKQRNNVATVFLLNHKKHFQILVKNPAITPQRVIEEYIEQQPYDTFQSSVPTQNSTQHGQSSASRHRFHQNTSEDRIDVTYSDQDEHVCKKTRTSSH